MSITYDSGALIAADRNQRRVWSVHAEALARGQRPVVPSVVLAQAWRGGPQAGLSRLLRGCVIEPLDEAGSRAAGAACAAAGVSDIVDAVVVVGALGRGDVVLTSDPRDFAHLAQSLGRRLSIQPI